MHPINKSHFGSATDRISVYFHNGTNLVNGYVVKQMGTYTYLVSDGTVNKIVRLTVKSDHVSYLDGTAVPAGSDYSAVADRGVMKINTGSSTLAVARLMSKTAILSDNSVVSWSRDPAAPVKVIKRSDVVLAISGTPAAGTHAVAYTYTPTVTGGAGAKTFARSGTALPTGLTLNSSTGVISGTVAAAGTTSGIVITVTDASGATASQTISITMA